MTTTLTDSPLPIVAAPMASGPSTLDLARAVASAGAFPFIAGGYKTPGALAEEIDQLRRTVAGFGVNLFVPSNSPVDEAAFAAYAAELKPEADAHGLELDPTPVTDDDGWKDKLALLIANPVPVVSLMFGLPGPADIAALQNVGTRVLATVTNPDEARQSREAGVDGLVVQGAAAGGHSAIFDPTQNPEPIGTDTLVRRVLEAVDLPVIATGGVDGPQSVRRLLDAGAQAVVAGTMLLRTDEAGTSATYLQALGNPAFTETVLTRAFTGRPARSLRNGFTDRHPGGITANPAVHHLTRALRQAASKSGDTDRVHLWAGTGWRNAPTGPAADVIRHLAEGA